MNELQQAAFRLLTAKSAFAQAWIRYWHGVEPCDDARGFEFLELFRTKVYHFGFELKRGIETGIEQGAREVYRLAAVADTPWPYDRSDVDRFCKWYEALKGRVGRAIGKLFDYHGDSFGDLCDGLPLWGGGTVVAQALATGGSHPRLGFLAEREINEAVLNYHGLQWHKCVGAELYVETKLEEQARYWFLNAALKGVPESDRSTVAYATYCDRI